VAVYNGGTGTLATIYDPNTDDSAPGGLCNPFVTTANGVFGFMAADGEYDVQISGGSLAAQQYRVTLSAANIYADLSASTGAGLIGYDKSLSYPAGTVGAQFNAQYTTGYVIDHAGSPSMAIVPTGFAQSMGIQSKVADTASRLYIMPNGYPSGTTAALKVFDTDYIDQANNHAATATYRDIGVYYDTVTGEFRLNSKRTVNAVPVTSCAPIYFTSNDGAFVHGGAFMMNVSGTDYPAFVFGSRAPAAGVGSVPVGFTQFASVPIFFTQSAAFLNNVMLRWYDAAGSSISSGIRLNASSEFEILIAGSVMFTQTTNVAKFAKAVVHVPLIGTAGQSTPNVSGTSYLQIPTNGSTYNITDFIGGAEGQELYILFSDNKPTIVNSGTLRLAGGVNFTGSAGSTLTLVKGASGWFEKCRSVN